MRNTVNSFIASAQALAASENAVQYFKRNTQTAGVLKRVCIDGMGYIETGINMGMTDQQVRNLLDAFSQALLDYARTGMLSESYVPFTLDADLAGTLRRIEEEGCPGQSIDELKEALGGANDGFVDVFLRCFGCSTYGPVDSIVDSQFAIPRGYGRRISPILRDINEILKDSVSPVRESAIRTKMRKADKTALDSSIGIMRHSHHYERTMDGDNTLFSLTWKELDGVQKRVERILWESSPAGMTKEDIETEYLTRLRLWGIHDTPKDIIIKESANIGGANGLWRWKDGGVEIVKDGRPLIQDYVVKKGSPVTLDEIVSYVNALGLKLKRASVRSYLLKCCKHDRKAGTYSLKDINAPAGRGDVTLLIAKSMKKNGCEMSIKDIVAATSLGKARIYSALNSHPDIFLRKTGRNAILYAIDPAWDWAYVPAKVAGRRTPAYHELVRCTAVQLLKNAASHSMPLSDMVKRIVDLVPDFVSAKRQRVYALLGSCTDDLSFSDLGNGRKSVALNASKYADAFRKPAFSMAMDWHMLQEKVVDLAARSFWMTRRDASRAAEGMLHIMGMGRMVTGDSYFHLMAEMLDGWFSGKLGRRDLEYTRNLLALNYEKYLRNLYELRNGNVLLTMPGLGKVIKDLQANGILPQRRSGDWMSDALGHIISARGSVAHPDLRDASPRVEENIREFLKLFLATALLLDEEATGRAAVGFGR